MSLSLSHPVFLTVSLPLYVSSCFLPHVSLLPVVSHLNLHMNLGGKLNSETLYWRQWWWRWVALQNKSFLVITWCALGHICCCFLRYQALMQMPEATTYHCGWSVFMQASDVCTQIHACTPSLHHSINTGSCSICAQVNTEKEFKQLTETHSNLKS